MLGIFKNSPPTFIIIVVQPDEQWTNGDDSAIQRIKEVWAPHWKKS
jgi:hypothetical protein